MNDSPQNEDSQKDEPLLTAPIAPETVGEGSELLARDEVSSLENERLSAELSGLIQDIEERKKYALRLFILLCCWMGFVGICFLLAGFGNGASEADRANTEVGKHILFKLSDSVLITLLAGATLNLIALFAIVAWYLFPKK